QNHLITGAARGVGPFSHLRKKAPFHSADLTIHLYVCRFSPRRRHRLQDPSAIVYAGIKELAGQYPGRIEVVKYVSGDEEGNNAIAALIKEKYGRVDTVIANAGACS
ncbi:hypothetical protein BJ912DRAFT_977034, partial [Pholiota molesta]